MPPTERQSTLTQLRASVTCPHCWSKFPPEQVLWISAHSDLLNDPLLKGQQERFIPTRFNVEGKALDRKGVACRRLACPQCHLPITPAFLEMDPLFISILGAPSSGKSYYLASMTWGLTSLLQSHFSVSFQDADPESNLVLSNYHEQLFLSTHPDVPVVLRKTEIDGELYERVTYADREVLYPRPFVFSLQPQESHPAYAKRGLISRALCLYDNAGEHYLPGAETANMPGTQHMALSRAMLFLFDPLQHARFRAQCEGKTEDPQIGRERKAYLQDRILLEALRRIRESGRLSYQEKYRNPLVVVVGKFDVWRCLLNLKRLDMTRVVRMMGPHLAALDLEILMAVSREVRSLLWDLAQEVVTAAESFSERVVYIPVSALGHSPEIDPKGGALVIRPKDINPIWAEVPMLYALHDAAGSLIRAGTRRATESQSIAAPHLYKETGS